MNLRQLTCFMRVAELQHVSKAADLLEISQPFLSKTIHDLESELGVSLFDHVGRQVVLNEYGQSFYAHIANIFSELEYAKDEIRDISSKKDSSIVLITNTSLYLGNLLPALKKVLPEVHFHLISAPLATIISSINDGTADFAVCTPPIRTEKDIETLILAEDFDPIIYPEGHWLQTHSQLQLHELAKEPFVSAVSGFGIRELTELYFHKSGLIPNFTIESTDTSLIPKLVENGLGIAFCPISTIVQDPFLIRHHIVVSEPACTNFASLSWNKHRYLTVMHKSFIDFITNYFTTLEDQTKILCRQNHLPYFPW